MSVLFVSSAWTEDINKQTIDMKINNFNVILNAFIYSPLPNIPLKHQKPENTVFSSLKKYNIKFI